MEIDKKIFYPAIMEMKATGKEHNPCFCCNKGLNKGDEAIALVSSAYKGNLSHTNRFHRRCFFFVLQMLYGKEFDDELIKEVAMAKLKDV